MKDTRGILAIEASISLTLFMMFILFFLSFARVYEAQNSVNHAAFEAAQALAVDEYGRKKMAGNSAVSILSSLDKLFNIGNPNMNDYRSLEKVNNLEEIVKRDFIMFFSGSETEYNNEQKRMGISEISFNSSKVKDKVLYVTVKYKVRMQFNIFGVDDLELQQNVKCKIF